MANNQTCPTCHTPRPDKYCPHCGERRLHRSDNSLATWLRRAARSIFNIDNKLFRTFKLLLVRPGFLTQEHLAGRRNPYVRPLQFFLMINVLYFLINPLTPENTFSTPLESHLKRQHYSQLLTPLIERQVDVNDDEAFAIYATEFDRVGDMLARTLIILIVPAMALVLKLLHWRRYYVEHLVFALHLLGYIVFYTVIMVVALLVVLVQLMMLFQQDALSLITELFITSLLFLFWTWYLFMAFRRLYRQRWWIGLGKSLVMALAIFCILPPYRLVLYFATLGWVNLFGGG